jgi:hypothetical protein
MNRDQVIQDMDEIRELIESAYQCFSHTRVIRGDGGSWLTDMERIRTLSEELIRSQRIWFDVVVGWKDIKGNTSGKTHVEVQAKDENAAGVFAMDKLKETQPWDEAWTEEVKRIDA